MSKIKLDIEPRGPEKIPGKTIKEQIKNYNYKMKEVGVYDNKDLNEAGVAVAKILNSLKESIDDDGELTFGDTTHFLDDVIPAFKGVSGAQNIPRNIAAITDEQKAEFKKTVVDELSFHPKDENATDKLIAWVFSTLDMLEAFGVIKPDVDLNPPAVV